MYVCVLYKCLIIYIYITRLAGDSAARSSFLNFRG